MMGRLKKPVDTGIMNQDFHIAYDHSDSEKQKIPMPSKLVDKGKFT